MKKLLSGFLSIFRFLGALLTFLRNFTLNLVFLLILAIIIVSLFAGKTEQIPQNAILRLNIQGNIVEHTQEDEELGAPVREFLGLPEEASETALQDIIDAIRCAAEDDRISAIRLDLSSMGAAGMDQLSRIGAELSAFRKSHKQVIAAEDYYTQDQYYLAAHADKIIINPLGGIHLSGFGLYKVYFKDALEKLKINYHVFRVGSYKTAVEPITRNSMSMEDRVQTRAWLNILWQNYLNDVSEKRNISVEALTNYINFLPQNLKKTDGNAVALALQSNLVDLVKNKVELHQYMKSNFGDAGEDELSYISLRRYLAHVDRSHTNHDQSKDTIAIIPLEGTILPGKSSRGVIGSDTIVSLIREAREASHIKAVVFRMNTGGGSAFASEVIRQEMLALKNEGKPVIISMGTLAASGGYWISAAADKIFATSNTLTGSIGIFLAFPTFERSLNHLGIYRDGVGTTNLSSSFDITQPLSPELKESLQLSLDFGYRTFLTVVSQGRNLSMEETEALAQGRIYSGETAQELGLVDEIGNLEQAISAGASLAGVDQYETILLSPFETLKKKFLGNFTLSDTIVKISERHLSEPLKNFVHTGLELQPLFQLDDPNSMFAHCMFDFQL